MSEYVVKDLPAVRLAALTATLDFDVVGERIGPMFDEAQEALGRDFADLETPIATYDMTDDGMDVVVGYGHVGPPPASLEIAELPAVAAVCATHLGPMSGIRASWDALHRYLADNGFEYDGPCRELYVRALDEDQLNWITELQQPVKQ